MYTTNHFFSGSKMRTAMMVLLGVVFVLSSFASVIHWLQPNAFLIDLVIPPLGVLWSGFLLARTYFFPASNLDKTFRGFILFAGFALIAPVWFYTWYAIHNTVRLVDIYPPITVLLLILTTMILLILDTRSALRWGGSIWALSALPLLLYLFTHKQELWSPRGLDLLVAYGPALFCVVAVVPFHRSFSSRVRQLSIEFEQMKSIAERDSLTDLFNRRGIEEAFSSISRLPNRESIAGMMLDIDHFKVINDQYGHGTGDRVLREVAARLRTVLDKPCALSRWGGEEFFILVPNMDELELDRVAGQFHRAIVDHPFNKVGKVTVSIGATMCQEESLESLADRADQALYEAKSQGRDRVVSH